MSLWLIVGLGNPGPKYELTRHNLGARIVEALQVSLEQPPFRAARALSARVSEGTAILAIPTTFMNDSGTAVRTLAKKFSIPLDRLLVVHDDKDLEFGAHRIQRNRGPAGHRGVESTIQSLGTQDFWRLRIGVGAPPPGRETDQFVLERFTTDEEARLSHDVMPIVIQSVRGKLGERDP